jgi:antitoxin component of MazEF toxin-antitoxin module
VQRKLYKLGNSRGIVVPQVLLDLMKWDDNTVLDVSVESDKLIFWAVAKKKRSLFDGAEENTEGLAGYLRK